jgi:hypothetical protein
VDVSAAVEGFPGGFRALQELFRPPGARTSPEFRFGGGGGGGSTVETGDYLVTLVVGGKEHKQVLRVVRVPGGGDPGSTFEEDEEEREP